MLTMLVFHGRLGVCKVRTVRDATKSALDQLFENHRTEGIKQVRHVISCMQSKKQLVGMQGIGPLFAFQFESVVLHDQTE